PGIVRDDTRRHTLPQVPRDCRISQRVRNDLVVEPGSNSRPLECLADIAHRLAVPLDEVALGNAEPLPATHVCEQARRQVNGRLPLVALDRAVGLAMEFAGVEIDVTTP